MIRQGQQVLDGSAALPCTTVAAINGFALGGGLEVALACRYRVVADDPSMTLGFPEVQLGVHPGFGGTVRAVQLAGPIAAMDLMLTGRIDPARNRRWRWAWSIGWRRPTQLEKSRSRSRSAPPPRRSSALKDRLLNSRCCARCSPGRCARRSRGARAPITTLLRTR